jgi:hypothetical protein
MGYRAGAEKVFRRCERWRWATTMKLDRPWANGVQAGMYLRHLRAEVLERLYA